MYCPATLLQRLCFPRIWSAKRRSYFKRTSQRVSVGRLHHAGRPCTYNHIGATGNEPLWEADKYSKVVNVALKNAAPLLDLLKPQPGERILDLGCGSGEVTMALKDAGSDVVAIDASPSMVEAAKAKGEKQATLHIYMSTGLDARLLDAHDLTFDGEFDAVFSHMALHWITKDPRQVVKNIYNALKKNGRFVAEFNGEGSWDLLIKPKMPILKRHGIPFTNPMYSPSKQEYADMLKSAGFHLKQISLLPRGMPVPGGPKTMADLFVSIFLADVDDSKKEQIVKELEAFEPKLNDEGNHIVDTVIMTVAAMKQS